jgi:hypothetical protein
MLHNYVAYPSFNAGFPFLQNAEVAEVMPLGPLLPSDPLQVSGLNSS